MPSICLPFFGGTSIFPVYIVRLHLLSLEVHHFRVGPEFAQGNWEQLPCKHIAAPPPSPRFMKSIYPAALLCCGRGHSDSFSRGRGKRKRAGKFHNSSLRCVPLTPLSHSLKPVRAGSILAMSEWLRRAPNLFSYY